MGGVMSGLHIVIFLGGGIMSEWHNVWVAKCLAGTMSGWHSV